MRDFDKSSPGVPVQATDKETGLPMWAVSVLDADPDARKNQKTVTVKIAARTSRCPRRPRRGCRSGRWREPLRVRAGWVSDDTIKELEAFVTGTTPPAVGGKLLALPGPDPAPASVSGKPFGGVA